MSGAHDDHHWFIFGEHPDGWVDIANAYGDVLTLIPKDVAEFVCEAHNDAVEALRRHYTEALMRRDCP